MENRSVFAILVVALLSPIGIQTAEAVPASLSRFAVPNTEAFLGEGEAELAPLAHVKFCMTNAGECAGESRANDAVIDDDAVGLIDRVNREVNRRIRPRAKFTTIGEWAINPASGDCNDYAVTKRHVLVSLGIPARALRLAVVRTRWGEGHLVLVARKRDGDYVLDNLSPRLVRWDATGHHFLKIQSAHDARNWASVEPTGPSSIGRLVAQPAAGGETSDWYVGQM